MRHLLPIAAALSAAALLAGPVDAWACAACACGDPTLTAAGMEKPFAGRVRLTLEGRYRSESWRAPEDPLPGRWRVDEGRVALGVAWAPHERVMVGAVLPMTATALQAPNLAWQRGFGLGDLELSTRVVAWRDRAHRHLFGPTVGLDLPTATPVRTPSGDRADEDLQPGTGAWVPSAGLWYGHYERPWAFFSSASLRVPVGGWDGRTPGLTGLVSAMVQVQPHPVVAPRLGADLRLGQPDRVDGTPDDGTGGWLLMASPGLALSPVEDLLVVAMVQLPVAQRLGGGTLREGVAPRLAVTLDL